MVVKVGLEPNTVQRRSRQPYLLRVGDSGTIPHYVHLTIYPLRQLNGLAAISEVGVSCYFRTPWSIWDSNPYHSPFSDRTS